MHGNTESCEGYKTRRYDNIRSEVLAGSVWHMMHAELHLHMARACSAVA